jgi:integrase
MPSYKKPRYVHIYKDRHGKTRVYFKKPGCSSTPLPLPLYSEEFWTTYHKALEGAAPAAPEAGASRIVPGTMADLVSRYLKSPDFLGLAPTSRTVYRKQLERFCEEHGSRKVKDLERVHLKAILGKMDDRKSAANNLLKRLKVLMNFAVDIGMRKDNPTTGMKGFKVKSDGFHTWTEDEIARFEAVHPVGSKARLAMALALYTGSRRSDVVRMGWHDVIGDRIKVKQQKTNARLELPIHPDLWALIADLPKGAPAFLLTEFRKPFTAAGFGNWMRDRCDEAGLAECSLHGLRKAIAVRLAEAGCTNQQIKAITGHATESEVARYTKGAEQKKLAGQAMKALQVDEAGTKVANPIKGVAKTGG